MVSKIIGASVLGLWLAASPAFAVIERRVERHFDVSGQAAFKIDTANGSVHLGEAAGAAIEIVIIERADVATEAEMDRRLTALDLNLAQTGDSVSVTARYRNSLTWTWKTWPPVLLSYEVRLPKKCDVTVITRDGDIVTGPLQGDIRLETENGMMFTGAIDGSLNARSRNGDIAITACSGAAEISTDLGNITLGRAAGRAQLSSKGGYIELQQAGGEVLVRGNGSDAKIGFVSPIKNKADIATSGGNVMLSIETNSACTLDLRSSVFGRVAVRTLPMKVTAGGEGRSLLAGNVGAGGPQIQVRASGGSVFLRGVDPLPDAVVLDPNLPAAL